MVARSSFQEEGSPFSPPYVESNVMILKKYGNTFRKRRQWFLKTIAINRTLAESRLNVALSGFIFINQPVPTS